MIDWWSESEHAILECLGDGAALSPEDLARCVGMSEQDTIAFVCMLAREGKLRIRLVGLADEPAATIASSAAWESASLPW